MPTVRKAQAEEFDRVMDFYTRMIDEMRGTDFDAHWEHGVHPSPEYVRAATEAGEVYVAIADGCGDEESFAAAMVLNAEDPEGCETARWRVAAEPGEALVVHVLGTLAAYRGRGFARVLVQGGIDEARAANKRAVRLATFADNAPARHLYESCGFAYVEACPFFFESLGMVVFALYEFVL